MTQSRLFSNAKLTIWSTVGVLIPLVVWLLLINECEFAGGMGARQKQCECFGYEWELYDLTPADGPRKTLCLGLTRSTTCYQFIGGPPVECDSP